MEGVGRGSLEVVTGCVGRACASWSSGVGSPPVGHLCCAEDVPCSPFFQQEQVDEALNVERFEEKPPESTLHTMSMDTSYFGARVCTSVCFRL